MWLMGLCVLRLRARAMIVKRTTVISISPLGKHIFNKVLTVFVGAALDLRRLRCHRRFRDS